MGCESAPARTVVYVPCNNVLWPYPSMILVKLGIALTYHCHFEIDGLKQFGIDVLI